MSVWRIYSLFLALVLLLWAQSSPAAGEIEDPLAQELKQTGDAAMVMGDYQMALDSYEKASAIEQSPSLLYNRARALQALQEYARALQHFEEFKRKAPESLLLRVPQLEEMITQVKKNVTYVTIELPVEEAKVSLRGTEIFEYAGKRLPFNAGPAVIAVQASGFAPFTKTYDLPGGTELVLKPILVALKTTGVLRVHSSAPAAEVLIDGKSVGMVPIELVVAPGPHKVVVRHPRYKTSNTVVVIERGQTRKLDVQLRIRPSLFKRWWFWAGVGSATVLGATVAIFATSEKKPDEGDIPPGTITVPIP